MKRALVAGAMAFVLAGPAAANGLGETIKDENIKQGRQLAERLCARCHAIGTEGDSPLAEAPLFRTMSAKWPIDSLAEAFAEGIVVGHPGMPEFQFEPEQIGALLDYLDSVQDP